MNEAAKRARENRRPSAIGTIAGSFMKRRQSQDFGGEGDSDDDLKA